MSFDLAEVPTASVEQSDIEATSGVDVEAEVTSDVDVDAVATSVVAESFGVLPLDTVAVDTVLRLELAAALLSNEIIKQVL